MKNYSLTAFFCFFFLVLSCANDPESETQQIIEEFSSDYAVHYGFCKDSNHPHEIDLGLPSGTKWSCCNIDAEIPFFTGKIYSWEGILFPEILSDYKYPYVKNYGSMYNPDDEYYYLADDVAMTEYDAAHAKWRGRWRLPNKDHFQELIDNCTIEKVRLHVKYKGEEGEVAGYTITGKNKTKIFLRSAGYFQFGSQYTGILYPNNRACYWSSTLCESKFNNSGYYFELWDNSIAPGYTVRIGAMDRKWGLPIRPICN